MDTIDLRSDTVTRPTPAMREAISTAPVGDDVYGEDPTVNRLQAMAAERLGKQAALFVGSGTMANQIAVRIHTDPGDALIVGRDAHVHLYEGGGAAALSGVQTVQVGEGGLFRGSDVREAIMPNDPHFARTRMISIENTHNRSGGRVFPLAWQHEIADVAADAGLAMHLDGARLFNAAAACGASAAELAAPYDTVAFCLSKGLGAPVGSLLCGTEELIERAKRVRKLFGGAMRQAGILAAAGVHALEHHVKRLVEDHDNAKRLAIGLAKIEGIRSCGTPETNMVLIEAPDAAALRAALLERDVLVGTLDAHMLRAVTHLDVGTGDIDAALVRIAEAMAALR